MNTDPLDKLKTAKVLEDIYKPSINNNNDYLILFFFSNSCSACKAVKPVVSKVLVNNNASKNCSMIAINVDKIKTNFNKMYEGGVPIFRVMIRNGNKYVPYHINTINNNKLSIILDGYVQEDVNENNKTILSTENALNYIFKHCNENPLKDDDEYELTNIEHSYKEKYSKIDLDDIYKNARIKRMQKKIYVEKDKDDGSGYTVMQLCDPYVKEINKSFNKIINDNLKSLDNFNHK